MTPHYRLRHLQRYLCHYYPGFRISPNWLTGNTLGTTQFIYTPQSYQHYRRNGTYNVPKRVYPVVTYIKSSFYFRFGSCLLRLCTPLQAQCSSRIARRLSTGMYRSRPTMRDSLEVRSLMEIIFKEIHVATNVICCCPISYMSGFSIPLNRLATHFINVYKVKLYRPSNWAVTIATCTLNTETSC